MLKMLFAAIAAALMITATSGVRTAYGQNCETAEFDSTYDLIQAAIFDRTGCSSQICHGEAKSGGLDLRAGVSYDNLVDVPAQSVPGFNMKRVTAGQSAQSLLWINLASKT